jgi:hypothetical protein
MAAKTYTCTNAACTLGSRETPGRFTGGITKEQATMLTGDPDADHGKGVCPNCGQPGKEES